jgi:hypothetical protein
MRYLYARCMDGSPAGVAGLAAVSLGTPVSLDALSSSCPSAEDLKELAVVELPDGVGPPPMLYPRY